VQEENSCKWARIRCVECDKQHSWAGFIFLWKYFSYKKFMETLTIISY